MKEAPPIRGPGAFTAPEDGTGGGRQRRVAIEAVLGLGGLAAKLGAAVLAGSTALWIDSIRTAGALARDLLGWSILRRVDRTGPDRPYDPGKLEGLFSLGSVALMSVGTGLLLVFTWRRFEAGIGPGAPVWGVAVGVVLGVGNLVLWRRAGRRATVSHRQADYGTRALGNLSVAGALSAAWLLPGAAAALDALGAGIAALLILRTAYETLSESLSVLLDETLEESYQLIILRHLAACFEEYSQFHGVRSRRSAGRAYIEIFLEFDPDRRLADVQRFMDRLRTELEGALGESRVFIVPVTERIR